MNQIKNKVYTTKKPEEVMETLTILAAALILPEAEIIRRFIDRTRNKHPYKYLDIASDVYAVKGMVPGDKLDPTIFNVNGWTARDQDEDEVDEAQLEEEIKTLKETLESTSDLLATTITSHDLLEKELASQRQTLAAATTREDELKKHAKNLETTMMHLMEERDILRTACSTHQSNCSAAYELLKAEQQKSDRYKEAYEASIADKSRVLEVLKTQMTPEFRSFLDHPSTIQFLQTRISKYHSSDGGWNSLVEDNPIDIPIQSTDTSDMKQAWVRFAKDTGMEDVYGKEFDSVMIRQENPSPISRPNYGNWIILAMECLRQISVRATDQSDEWTSVNVATRTKIGELFRRYHDFLNDTLEDPQRQIDGLTVLLRILPAGLHGFIDPRFLGQLPPMYHCMILGMNRKDKRASLGPILDDLAKVQPPAKVRLPREVRALLPDVGIEGFLRTKPKKKTTTIPTTPLLCAAPAKKPPTSDAPIQTVIDCTTSPDEQKTSETPNDQFADDRKPAATESRQEARKRMAQSCEDLFDVFHNRAKERNTAKRQQFDRSS